MTPIILSTLGGLLMGVVASLLFAPRHVDRMLVSAMLGTSGGFIGAVLTTLVTRLTSPFFGALVGATVLLIAYEGIVRRARAA